MIFGISTQKMLKIDLGQYFFEIVPPLKLISIKEHNYSFYDGVFFEKYPKFWSKTIVFGHFRLPEVTIFYFTT